MATQTHESTAPPVDENKLKEERAAKAKEIFDGYEKDSGLPLTTQTDQLRRSLDMEQVGVSAYMAEQEKRIRAREGEHPPAGRQLPGVAPVQRPAH